METLILRSNSKKDVVLLLEIAKKIGIDLKVVSKTKIEEKSLTAKEKLFYKKFETAVKQSKEIASGKQKGIPLKEALDEI